MNKIKVTNKVAYLKLQQEMLGLAITTINKEDSTSQKIETIDKVYELLMSKAHETLDIGKPE